MTNEKKTEEGGCKMLKNMIRSTSYKIGDAYGSNFFIASNVYEKKITTGSPYAYSYIVLKCKKCGKRTARSTKKMEDIDGMQCECQQTIKESLEISKQLSPEEQLIKNKLNQKKLKAQQNREWFAAFVKKNQQIQQAKKIRRT